MNFCGIPSCKSGSKNLFKVTKSTNIVTYYGIAPSLICQDCFKKADKFMADAIQDVKNGKINFIKKERPQHPVESPDVEETLFEVDEGDIDRTIKRLLVKGKVIENLETQTQEAMSEVVKQKQEYDELEGQMDYVGNHIQNLFQALQDANAVVVEEVDAIEED